MSLVIDVLTGPALWVTLLALGLAAVLARSTFLNWTKVPLPPGPPGDPIIGHVRSLPAESSWLYYAKLQKQYGTSELASAALLLC